MQSDTKHQKDHAHLGELGCELTVSHEAGRIGADHDACNEISDKRRQAQPIREIAQYRCEHEANGNGCD